MKKLVITIAISLAAALSIFAGQEENAPTVYLHSSFALDHDYTFAWVATVYYPSDKPGYRRVEGVFKVTNNTSTSRTFDPHTVRVTLEAGSMAWGCSTTGPSIKLEPSQTGTFSLYFEAPEDL